MTRKNINKTFTLQHGQSDCGVACLSSIINYYEGSLPTLERLRQLSGTTKQGTTLLGLYQAANSIGFDAEGLKAKGIDDLITLNDTPVILHVVLAGGLQHYVVYYTHHKGHFIIGDPAKGIIRYSKDMLEKIWDGKMLLKLMPNSDFVRASILKERKKKWILNLLRQDFGILSTSVFIGILITLLGLSTAIFSQRLIDEILPTSNIIRLSIGLTLLAILLFARSGLAYLRAFFILKQGKGLNNRIINNFYGNILRLPKIFFDSKKTGELVARMNDTRRIQATIGTLAGNVVIDALLIIVSIALTFLYSKMIGLIMVTSLPIYLFFALVLNKKILLSQNEVMSSYAQTESHFIESIQGVSTIKVHTKEYFFEKLNQSVFDLFQSKIFSLGKINIKFGLLSEIIGTFFIVLLFGMCSWLVLVKSITLGQFVALISIAAGIIPSIIRLVVANIQLQEARVAFERMFDVTSLEPEGISNYCVPFPNFRVLTVNKVSFRFPGRPKLLKEISFQVNQSEMICLLGESGSGKSSILQILQRFYYPETGNIYINEVLWNEVDIRHWRQAFGVVPQEIKFFSGTLSFNISLSDAPEDVGEVIQFCKSIGFSNYFEQFPQGYSTNLGEEGVNISGGQKQLVALARALYNKPKLLILDEPTSAMDKKTEAFVLTLLATIKKQCAIVLVTHRPSMTLMADRIYFLENGELYISKI